MAIERARVPSALSGARAVLALTLPALAGAPWAAVAVLAVCAATDVLDGRLARRWDVASARGARADSLADLVLSCAVVVTVLLALPARSRVVALAVVGAVVVVRGASLVVSWRRFGAPLFVHTVLNKVTGAVMVVGAAVTLASGSVVPVVVVGVVALVSGLEELAVHATAREHEPDRRWLVSAGREGEDLVAPR